MKTRQKENLIESNYAFNERKYVTGKKEKRVESESGHRGKENLVRQNIVKGKYCEKYQEKDQINHSQKTRAKNTNKKILQIKRTKQMKVKMEDKKKQENTRKKRENYGRTTRRKIPTQNLIKPKRKHKIE